MGTQGKTTLHYVEVVEACDTNETIPLRVVTRAQAQQQDQQAEKQEIKRNPEKEHGEKPQTRQHPLTIHN